MLGGGCISISPASIGKSPSVLSPKSPLSPQSDLKEKTPIIIQTKI